MGIGGGITLDEAGFLKRFSAQLSYAYKIKLGTNNHNLRLGLSGGIYQITLDATQATVQDNSDDVLGGGPQSGTTFDTEFGIFYNYQGFQLSVSVPQVFENRTDFNLQDLDNGLGNQRHFVAYSSYNWKLNDKWKLEPSVLFKNANTDLNQLDFNALVTYNQLISVGGGYRTNVGPLARLGINIKDLFVLGYAYEFPVSNIASFSTGSHEILLAIRFCKDQPKKDQLEEANEPVVTPELADTISETKTESFGEESPETSQTNPDPTQQPEEEALKAVQTTPESNEEPAKEEGSEALETTVLTNEEPTPTSLIKEPTGKELNKEIFKVAILFPLNNTGSYDLSKNKSLNQIAEELKKFPAQKVQVIGHACNRGDDRLNNRLG